MLEGCVPWPADFAARYRAKGYWPDISLCQMLEDTIRKQPDACAVSFHNERISYRQLGERIERLAVQFVHTGLRPRDRVVLQLQNGTDFLAVFFALLRMGAIPILALPAHRQQEIGHFISASAATAYIAPACWRGFDYRPMAAAMASQHASLRTVIIAGEPAADQIGLDDLKDAPPPAEAAAAVRAYAPDPADVAFMLLSGGTTGLPKLIPRTHNDYIYNCRQSGRIADYDSTTVFLATLPLAHNFTLGSPGAMAALAAGGRVVIAPELTAEAIFPLIARERVTIVAAALPLVVSWLASREPEQHDLSSLRVFMCGGAKMAPELRARVEERLGCIYQESFGTGEGLLNMTRLDDARDIRMHSSGAPVSPDDEIKVVGEDGRELPDGEVGELLCRGPYTIRGYYAAPEASRAAFTADGFYRMGDAVRKNGRYLTVEGRLKDLINRGGEKISSEEVENHLLAHPQIENVCVVAMPDPHYGEKACAFVIAREGAALCLDGVKDFLLARQIAKFKIPERLEVVPSFPTSAAGKILRRELRRMVAEKIEGDLAAAAARAASGVQPEQQLKQT